MGKFPCKIPDLHFVKSFFTENCWIYSFTNLYNFLLNVTIGGGGHQICYSALLKGGSKQWENGLSK